MSRHCRYSLTLILVSCFLILHVFAVAPGIKKHGCRDHRSSSVLDEDSLNDSSEECDDDHKENEDKESSGLGTAACAGILVGIFVIVVGLTGIVWYTCCSCCRTNKRGQIISVPAQPFTPNAQQQAPPPYAITILDSEGRSEKELNSTTYLHITPEPNKIEYDNDSPPSYSEITETGTMGAAPNAPPEEPFYSKVDHNRS